MAKDNLGVDDGAARKPGHGDLLVDPAKTGQLPATKYPCIGFAGIWPDRMHALYAGWLLDKDMRLRVTACLNKDRLTYRVLARWLVEIAWGVDQSVSLVRALLGELRRRRAIELFFEASSYLLFAGQKFAICALNLCRRMRAWPTVFHLTQYKAGSQWIYHILKRCAPERVVTPKLRVEHAIKDPILAGYIYPTVYLTKEDFEQIKKPTDATFFIILRDLRDITVSAYFSLKISHVALGRISEKREELCRRDLESGLIWVIENETQYSADIGRSWAESGEQWIRYEDLLTRDIELLEEALLYRCRLPIKGPVLRQAILSCRFDQFSGGRRRGEEDIHSHVRKGVPGDWQQYFSAPVKAAFKERFGDVLIACGYEKSNDW